MLCHLFGHSLSSLLHNSPVRLSVPCLVLRSQGFLGGAFPKCGGPPGIEQQQWCLGSQARGLVLCRLCRPLSTQTAWQSWQASGKGPGPQSSGCDSRWGAGTEQQLGVLAANSLVPEVASQEGQMAHLVCLGLQPHSGQARHSHQRKQPYIIPRAPPTAPLPPHPVPQAGRGPGLRLPVRGRLA